jgi:hypothetical protein
MNNQILQFSVNNINLRNFLTILVALSLLFSLINKSVFGENTNDDLEIFKINLIKDQNEYKHLIGIVQNIGNKTVNHIIVSANFLDIDKKSVGNFSKQTEIRTLNPDEITPIDILIFDKKINEKINDYLTNINYNITNYKDKKLVLISDNSKLEITGFYFINGDVLNTGKSYSFNTNVISILYNKNNEIIGVWEALTEPFNIPPSTQAPFTIPVTDKTQTFQISNYTLLTESDNFSILE